LLFVSLAGLIGVGAPAALGGLACALADEGVTMDAIATDPTRAVALNATAARRQARESADVWTDTPGFPSPVFGTREKSSRIIVSVQPSCVWERL
jgi:hypothetical protein